MLVEMQIEIFDGQVSGLFSNEPFEKRLMMTIEDFVLHSDDHFESHLLGNGCMSCTFLGGGKSGFGKKKGNFPSCSTVRSDYRL